LIAELFSEGYDTEGRPTFRPDEKRRGRFPSTFPIGRYVSHSLSFKCKSLEDLRKFLTNCRTVSDKEQFGKDDYWMPPEEFERSRKGDCDDFAMYAWRQLLEMGYKPRFVAGTVAYSREGHAWVTFEKDGKHFLLEPQARFLGLRFPRLDALRYKPFVSAEWDGKKAHFFLHKEREFTPPVTQIPLLSLEWAAYHLAHLPLLAYWLLVGLSKRTIRMLSRRTKSRNQRP
jgi:transglutaminase-like cysteine proteinase BTLCP